MQALEGMLHLPGRRRSPPTALKDVDLAISAAGGEAPPLLAALSGQWHAAVAAGHGRQDISAARLALPTPNHTS